MQVTDQETEVRPAEFLVQSNCGPLFCGCSLIPRLNLYNLPCKLEAWCRGVTWVWGGRRGEECIDDCFVDFQLRQLSSAATRSMAPVTLLCCSSSVAPWPPLVTLSPGHTAVPRLFMLQTWHSGVTRGRGSYLAPLLSSVSASSSPGPHTLWSKIESTKRQHHCTGKIQRTSVPPLCTYNAFNLHYALDFDKYKTSKALLVFVIARQNV